MSEEGSIPKNRKDVCDIVFLIDAAEQEQH